VAQIDEQLEVIERERQRLVAARAALTSEHPVSTPSGARRISQDDVAVFLREHPGSRAGEIAKALGVPLTTVSQHLYRGKRKRFVDKVDGWHLRGAT
jgi:DNA-directed RNA polymerase specialized sigma24 family protein